jgi:hypothetical protein
MATVYKKECNRFSFDLLFVRCLRSKLFGDTSLDSYPPRGGRGFNATRCDKGSDNRRATHIFLPR